MKHTDEPMVRWCNPPRSFRSRKLDRCSCTWLFKLKIKSRLHEKETMMWIFWPIGAFIAWDMSKPAGNTDGKRLLMVLGGFVLVLTVGLWCGLLWGTYPVWCSAKTAVEWEDEAKEEIEALRHELQKLPKPAGSATGTGPRRQSPQERAAAELNAAERVLASGHVEDISDFIRRSRFSEALNDARRGRRLLAK